jgi:hypothetical protein
MLTVVIVAFLVAFLSVAPKRIVTMGSSPFFIFQAIPIPYWIALCVIVCALFFMIPHLKEKHFQIAFIFSSILLIFCFRMAFPIEFTTVPAYEPDAASYMTIVNSWVKNGVDFGVQGNYQHNFPMSFLVAYSFVKLGVPLDTFFRIAPFAIYAIDILFLYLIVKEVMPEDKKKSVIPLVSVFLFSFLSLGYWVTVHYSPDIFGSMMFFVCLYLAVRFAKAEGWSAKSAMPVFVSIFILILSHHLSTLYLVVTFFGLALSVWFFKPAQFKKGFLAFLILAIFTYTAWFVFGEIAYPSFFNIYSYLSGFANVAQQSGSAGFLTNVSFAVYPAFILILYAVEFLKILNIRDPKSVIMNIRQKIREIQTRESSNSLLAFSMGFGLIFVLFIVGLPLPVLFGTRILEVLFIGLYPFAGQTLINLTDGKSSRKKALILVILLIVVLISNYRYYTQIQRRVIIA